MESRIELSSLLLGHGNGLLPKVTIWRLRLGALVTDGEIVGQEARLVLSDVE